MLQFLEPIVEIDARRSEDEEALRSDAAIDEWFRKYYHARNVPWVRASVYQRAGIAIDHLIVPEFRHIAGDVPVFMRSALKHRKNRYRTQSAYAQILVETYLEKIKFCAFRPQETDAMRRFVFEHIRKRGHYVHDRYNLIGTAIGGRYKGECRWYEDGRFRFGTFADYQRCRKLRAPSILIRGKKFEIVVQAKNLPPIERPSPWPKPVEVPQLPTLSAKQRKEAAYIALKELGLKFGGERR